jgi:hypothetical protein
MQIPDENLIKLLLPLWHRDTKKRKERCYVPKLLLIGVLILVGVLLFLLFLRFSSSFAGAFHERVRSHPQSHPS